jgi:hypothetical protein
MKLAILILQFLSYVIGSLCLISGIKYRAWQPCLVAGLLFLGGAVVSFLKCCRTNK